MSNKIENNSVYGRCGDAVIIDKIDLGTNYNGYPLECIDEDDFNKLYETVMDNAVKRFRKNVDYQLVLAVVPVIKNQSASDQITTT